MSQSRIGYFAASQIKIPTSSHPPKVRQVVVRDRSLGQESHIPEAHRTRRRSSGRILDFVPDPLQGSQIDRPLGFRRNRFS